MDEITDPEKPGATVEAAHMNLASRPQRCWFHWELSIRGSGAWVTLVPSAAEVRGTPVPVPAPILPQPSCSSSSQELLKPEYSGSACNPNSPQSQPSSHGGGTCKQMWPHIQQTCPRYWCPGCTKQWHQLQQQQGTSNLRGISTDKGGHQVTFPAEEVERGASVQFCLSVGSDSLTPWTAAC